MPTTTNRDTIAAVQAESGPDLTTGGDATTAPTRPIKPRTIKVVLNVAADQERFDALVQLSGLSQAEYVRRCCLGRTVKVVPLANRLTAAELGPVQVTVRKLIKQLTQQVKAQPEFRGLVGLLEMAQSINTDLSTVRRALTGRLVKLAVTPEPESDPEAPVSAVDPAAP